MTNTRNILLIGKTGSGKSALANVITGTNEFREGEFGISQTKKVQTEEFDTKGKEIRIIQGQIKKLEKENQNVHNSNIDYRQQHERKINELKVKLEELEKENIRYKIIDTVGISDTTEGTKMSFNKVLYNLAKVGRIAKDGLNQILLVTDGKNEEQTKALYNLLKETVFDENMAQYTTIVRTRFESFRSEKKCSEDREVIVNNNQDFREMINRIIHVDNPSSIIDIGNSEINEEEISDEIEMKKLNKDLRESSRKKLLKHLVPCQNIYKPTNLNELNKITDKEWKDKEVLELRMTKKFIQHIKKRDSKLREEDKNELDKIWKEIEEKELDKTELKENELSKQVENQLIRELKELNYLLAKNQIFSFDKRIINLELIGEEERKLINEIIFNQKEIIKNLEESINEKKENLQKTIEEEIKISRRILNRKSIQKSLEDVCQLQGDLTKSEMELENVKKIIEKIEDYKERLEQYLEARVEQPIFHSYTQY